MGDAAGADQGDAFRGGVAGLAQRPPKDVGAGRGRQGRALAVDVDRNDRHLPLGQQEVERHHDAVVELPFLGIGQVHVGHHGLNQAARQRRGTGEAPRCDAQPVRILNGTLVVVGHAHAVGGHVVHEEVGEVLGRHHHQRIRPRGADLGTHAVHGGVEGFAQLWVGALRPPRDARRVAAHACVNQGHYTAPCPSVVV